MTFIYFFFGWLTGIITAPIIYIWVWSQPIPDYTVCAKGCDFQTVEQMNNATFKDGDFIAFKRGETFKLGVE